MGSGLGAGVSGRGQAGEFAREATLRLGVAVAVAVAVAVSVSVGGVAVAAVAAVTGTGGRNSLCDRSLGLVRCHVQRERDHTGSPCHLGLT